MLGGDEETVDRRPSGTDADGANELGVLTQPMLNPLDDGGFVEDTHEGTHDSVDL